MAQTARVAAPAVDPAPAGDLDARRRSILDAAAETLGERGFGETRIADVARRAGVSSALVLYYFGTKDRLLTEALRWSEDAFYDAVAGLLAQLPTAAERLERLVRLTLVRQGEHEAPGVWGLYFDLWAQALRRLEVAQHRVDIDRRWRQTIAGVVRDGQAAGEVPAAVDADDFAVAFAALLDGLSIQVALEDPDVDPDRATALALAYATDALAPA